MVDEPDPICGCQRAPDQVRVSRIPIGRVGAQIGYQFRSNISKGAG